MSGTRPLDHDDLYAIPVPSDPRLSPDGSLVAFVVTTADRQLDDYRSEIWVVPAAGGERRRLTAGRRDSAPRWAPDGSSLAFLAGRGSDPPQLYLLPLSGGEASKVTSLPGGAGTPAWSPNGTRLAFAAAVDPGGADTEPIVVDRLDYKADGAGLIRGRTSQVFVVEAQPGSDAEQLTFGAFSVTSGPIWSPGGESLAFSAGHGDGSDIDPVSSLFTVPAAGGRPRPIGPRTGMLQVADWSRDGSSILVHGQERLDAAAHTRLWAVALESGELTSLFPDFELNVMPGAPGYPGGTPCFSAEGLLFCVRDAGRVHVYSTAGGSPSLVQGGERVVSGFSAAGSRLAYVAADPASPGEIWVGGSKLTNLFSEALPDVRLVSPEARRFEAPDGKHLQGWLIRDPDLQEGAAPLLLDIHGGPHNSWSPVFDGCHLYHQTLAAAGWTVLVLDPRGSDGYGEDFRQAVIGGWGRADEGDFLAALDQLIGSGLADPGRLAVSGYSYGGFMTCWLTGRTDRFAAAVAGGCVSDLLSLAGTSDLGRVITDNEIGASVTDDSRSTLIELSPLTYANGVRAPTLLLHGQADDRCPVGQAEEWFAALRQSGVEAQMVRYPGGSHLFILQGRPSHRVDYGRRIHTWVTGHTAGKSHPPRLRRRHPAADLQHRLDRLIARHRVPGASLAILADGEVTTAASGVVNLDTGVKATAESVFQIGSITKPYTATLVMQLVDEGRLDLDAPIVEYLPEFTVADAGTAKSVTMRHLLTHTSGIEGDHFLDTGPGDDCVAKLVASCADLGQTHPLGVTMSYCNSGYVIAGRIVEVLTGGTWDAALQQRICEPLGLSRTLTLLDDVLRTNSATGHVEDDGVIGLAKVWSLPRSCGPAGLICSTASEVLQFAAMHLRGGTPVLSADSVAAMQQPQVEVPDRFTLGSHWGLGWILFEWEDRQVFGHDGNTLGQSAFLRAVPDAGLALALLTNGGHAQDLYYELFGGLLDELAGLTLPSRPVPPPEPIEGELDLDRHTGVYERLGSRIEVTRVGPGLLATTIDTSPLAKLVPDPKAEYPMVALDRDLFVVRPPGSRTWMPMVFYQLADGSPYLHFGVRATPKVS